MDPLSAVGLVGNIVQFIQFSSNLLSATSEIYHSSTGITTNNLELDTVASQISEFCDKVTRGQLDVARKDSSLLVLADLCKDVAQELTTTIDKIKGKSQDGGSNYKGKSFGRAIRGILKTDDLNKLNARLQNLRSQIDTQLLAVIREEQLEIQASLLSLQSSYQGPTAFPVASWVHHESEGSPLLHIKGQTSCPQDASRNRDRTIESVLRTTQTWETGESTNTTAGLAQGLSLDHVNHMLNNMRSCAEFADGMKKEKRVIASLRFENMYVREAQIQTAHSETFDWILQSSDITEPGKHMFQDVHFVEWLREFGGIFWVAGKPGSGESTLMKHIFNQASTRTNLEIWAHGHTLIMASYFFWHRGNEIQRSQEGLLQSLLYTILEAIPGLVGELFPTRMENPDKVWTRADLLRAFESLSSAHTSRLKFCLFVDGLDEYSGDHFDLVQLLQNLSLLPSFKLCLASRPWNCYKVAFGNITNRYFYLQDLTKPDIELYTRSTLGQESRQDFPRENPQEFDELVQEVLTKSQGVFLWVALVVRSLREGIGNDDSILMLKMRVASFPSELEEFFMALIQSVDKTYQTIMAKTFLTALQTTAFPLVTHSFLEEPWDYPLDLAFESFPPQTIASIQRRIKIRINGRYKGLLECCKAPQQPQGYTAWLVEFLHRTVRDFLQTATVQAMLLAHVEDDFDADAQLCRIRLAQMKTMPVMACHHQKMVVDILHHARLHEERSGKCDYDMHKSLMGHLLARTDYQLDGPAQYAVLAAKSGLCVFMSQFLERHMDVLRNPAVWTQVLRNIEPQLRAKGGNEMPLKMIALFLGHGSDPLHPDLANLLDDHRFSADECSRLAMLVRRHRDKKFRGRKRKHKRMDAQIVKQRAQSHNSESGHRKKRTGNISAKIRRNKK